MDVSRRLVFLAGFGWAGVASLLTWAIPVIGGAPLSNNAVELLFGVLIAAGVGHAVYHGRGREPSDVSLALAAAAAALSTLELFGAAF